MNQLRIKFYLKYQVQREVEFMLKRIFFIMSIVLVFGHLAFAETLYLKSGKTIKGKILEKGSNYVIIQDGEFPNKYFYASIERIEEDPSAVAALTAAIAYSKFPNISAEKMALIISFLDINGTRSSMDKKFQEILLQVSPQKKDFFQKMLKVERIMELIIPIYDKYFSEDELKQLIEFYQSPLGKKMVDIMPSLMQETMKSSVDYFQKLGTESISTQQ